VTMMVSIVACCHGNRNRQRNEQRDCSEAVLLSGFQFFLPIFRIALTWVSALEAHLEEEKDSGDGSGTGSPYLSGARMRLVTLFVNVEDAGKTRTKASVRGASVTGRVLKTQKLCVHMNA